MKIFEVNSGKLERDFLEVHVLLNKPFPNWIRPLDVDVMSVFDPKKNKLLAKSEAIRWVLKDDKGKLIGRIAAFVNKRYTNKGDDVPVGIADGRDIQAHVDGVAVAVLKLQFFPAQFACLE